MNRDRIVLASVNVGLPRTHCDAKSSDSEQSSWTTGFFKEPVAGPVTVGLTNLEGDGQADLRVHGGVDKAVLAYSADHYAAWREELDDSDLPPGAFGENLTIAGLDENHVCIGDVWRIAYSVSARSTWTWTISSRRAKKASITWGSN